MVGHPSSHLPVTEGVREYLDYLEVQRGLAANSVESYRRDLRRYEQALASRGRHCLADVAASDVAWFLAALREGDAEHDPLAVSSAARALVAVRGMHAFLLAQGLADTDPAREISPPSPPKRLPKAIALAEVERLLDAAGPAPHLASDPVSGLVSDSVSVSGLAPGLASAADPRAMRNRALLEFLYGTGARISEATGLDIDELQLDDDPVVRLIGKGDKHRIVPVGSYAVSALQAYLVRARPVLAAAAPPGNPGAPVVQKPRGARHNRPGARGKHPTPPDQPGIDAV